MFDKPRHNEKIDDVIDALLDTMAVTQADSDEYAKMADQLIKLQKLQVDTNPKPVDKNTLATIAANLFGIGLILGYERANVVTSKALSFVIRTR